MPGARDTGKTADAAKPANAITARPTAESRMVALIIDPSVVGTDAVAAVSPHEIPAYEPPAPEVSSHVPAYERTALGPADPADRR